MPTFNAMEKTEASNHLNSVTLIHPNLNFMPTAPIYIYLELIKKIKHGKRFRIFTNNLTAFPHPFIPNLYITNLGNLVFKIIQDNIQNPFTMRRLQNTLIHPEIQLLSQLMFNHALHTFNINAYQQIEHACETCFADFKVQIQTRAFITQSSSWEAQYRTCSNSYDRFLEFIYGETNIFEVHSLVVQRKRPNGLEPSFDDPDFRSLSAYEIVREKCSEIIQAVWRKRRNNNVLGILSCEEIDLEQTCSIRLILFVKRDFSDLIPFTETPLHQELEPYLIDHNLDRIAFGAVSTMNSGISPLFQGQELNYYDLNQLHVGNRLAVLKAQLVIPNYWFRISDNSCTLTIERSRNHYER